MKKKEKMGSGILKHLFSEQYAKKGFRVPKLGRRLKASKKSGLSKKRNSSQKKTK